MTDYRSVFNAMPGVHGLLLPNAPEFTIVAATDEFVAFAGAERGDFIGSSLFRYFPDNPEVPAVSANIRESLAKCLETRRKNELPVQRYDILNAAGTFDEMYWTVVHTPILDAEGHVEFIIHTAIDLTDKILSDQKDARIRSLEPAYDLITQTAIPVHIFKGEDMVIAMANAPTLTLWGVGDTVIGQPLMEVLPGFYEPRYVDNIRNVFETGDTFRAHEAPIRVVRNGTAVDGYFNMIMQPYYERGKVRPTGVLVMMNEVSDVYHSRRALAEKERNLDLAVEIAGLGMFILNPRTGIATVSTQVMEWFGIVSPQVSIARLLDRVHPDDTEAVRQTLDDLKNGRETGRYELVFRVTEPTTGEVRHLRSIAQSRTEGGQTVLSGILQDITRIVRSRQEIEESEQRLRSLIASAPFPIALYEGREMKVVMANQSLIDVWGKGPDIFGRTYYEMLPELEGTGVFENLDRVFMTGKPYHAHNERVDLVVEGVLQRFWFNYSFLPLFDAGGNVYGVVNTAADVTDLNLAKEEVEESEYRYRTLIEESTVAAALYTGPDLRIQYANDIMLGYWGKDKSVIGLPLSEAVPELEGQPFLKQLDRVFTHGETVSAFQERALLRRDGELRECYYNYNYKPLHDANGQVYGIHHMAIDVTAEVLAKKQIEETAVNFRNMIMQAPVAITVLKGTDFVFDIVNPMMSELVGHPISELEGRPMFTAMPELLDDNLEPKLEAVMAHGISFVSDEQAFELLREGKMATVYIRYIYEPMKDASGHVEGIMVVANDVTPQVLARRKIEDIVANRTRELGDANQRLERSNAELKQFAYIASHDLQEPLRKISMFSQRLVGSLGKLDSESQLYMDRITSSVSRMSNLIRDVLGYSQLSREHDPFVMTDLNAIFSESLADFDLILEENGGKVLAENLPTLDAIPLQMVQLFHNLISNSLKYSRPGVPPVISISGGAVTEAERLQYKLPEMPEGYCKLVFRDNGIGFPEEYADRIFQIFQRLHGKSEYEGTGIGLAMCRKIAENHKGMIQATGREGKGAAFTVLLPLRQSD